VKIASDVQNSVAIMQPTYLPWAGYFSLINMVDTFVIYDDVQFDKRSWQQRNKIKTLTGPQWLSISVDSKGKYKQKINEVSISQQSHDYKTHIRALHQNYSKAPFFKDHSDAIFKCLGAYTSLLAELNTSLIGLICQILGINTKLVRSSDLGIGGVKEARLINICKHLAGTQYISPQGSKAYLNESDAFCGSSVELVYQVFDHPEYPQIHGEFIPYMSILDMLFNCGSEKTLELIKVASSLELNKPNLLVG